MKTKRLISLMLLVLLFLGAAVSPSYAHVKRRYGPSRKPPMRNIAHTHDNAEQKKEQKDKVAPKKEKKQETKKAKKESLCPQIQKNRTGHRFGMPGRK